MEAFRKISQQTLWQLLGKVITSLSTFIILAAVSRSFGEEGTGVFTLTLAFLSFFYLAADLGLNGVILPQVLTDRVFFHWRRILGLRLFLGVILIVVAFLLSFFWQGPSSFKQSVWFGSLAILGSAIFTSATLLFQARLKFNLAFYASSLEALLSLGLILLLIHFHFPLPYLLLGPSLGFLAASFLALFLLKTKILPILDLAYIKKIFLKAWPISLMLLLNIVYFRVDVFILSASRSLAEVGIYNLAYQIFQALLVLPTFIMNSLYPILVLDLQSTEKKFQKKLYQSAFFMSLAGLSGTVLTLIFSPWVINLLTQGKGFLGSVTSLRILSLGFPAFFLSAVFLWGLIALNKYKQLLIIYLIGLIFNLTLNLVFIPDYSFLAASYITVFSEYLILILQLGILARYYAKLPYLH